MHGLQYAWYLEINVCGGNKEAGGWVQCLTGYADSTVTVYQLAMQWCRCWNWRMAIYMHRRSRFCKRPGARLECVSV